MKKGESKELILRDGETLLDAVSEVTESEDMIAVVCPFFKLGKAAKCFGCKQEEDTVDDCKLALIDGLIKRPDYAKPGMCWTPTFDLPMVHKRDTKQKITETISMGLVCNTCHVSDSCPLYQENFECGIDWKEGVDTSDPKALVSFLIDIQTERVTRARKMELVDGGMPDQTTSGEMDRLTGLINTKDAMDSDSFSFKVEANGKGAAGGGILAKLFGGAGGQPQLEQEKTIELPEAEVVNSADDILSKIKTIDYEDLETKPATRDKRDKSEDITIPKRKIKRNNG